MGTLTYDEKDNDGDYTPSVNRSIMTYNLLSLLLLPSLSRTPLPDPIHRARVRDERPRHLVNRRHEV